MSGPVAAGPRSARPTRSPLLGQGLAALLVAAVLVAAAAAGSGVLAAAVLLLQVLLGLGLLGVLATAARVHAGVLVVLTAAAADIAVLTSHGDVDVLAGVVGLGLVAALLLQLVRAERSAVTRSLADMLLAVVLVCSAGCLVAVRERAHGVQALAVALVAAGAALLAGRLGDRQRPAPRLRDDVDRSRAGLLLAAVAGAAAGALVALTTPRVDAGEGALLGLAAAAAVVVADLAVELAYVGLVVGDSSTARTGTRSPGDSSTARTGTRSPGVGAHPVRVTGRRLASLRPVTALLPYALLGPVALVAARVVS